MVHEPMADSMDVASAAQAAPKRRAAQQAAGAILRAASLASQDAIIQYTIVSYLGTHNPKRHHPLVKWTKEKHWLCKFPGQKNGELVSQCGQNCPCCRAANPEDEAGCCEECNNMIALRAVSKWFGHLVRIFPGHDTWDGVSLIELQIHARLIDAAFRM